MSKTKAEIKGLKQVSEDVKTFVKSAIKDKELLEIVAKETVDQIQKQTRGRLGDYKQPPLKDSTKDRRATLIKQGNKSEFAEAKRSNLTLSGQLLDSITSRINQAQGLITIFFKENRKPYKGKKGQELENKTNKEIQQDLEKIGRKFFFISDRLNAQLQSKVKSYLRQKLANFRKLKRSLK